jgi:uncharacterized membrane protein YcjF (UPF0283 family)
VKFISDTVKSLWTGVLHAIAMLLVIAVGSWLIAQIPAIKAWAVTRLLLLGAPEKASLTIFLGVLSLALLGLWIAAQIALYRLRKRVQNKSLTLHDILGEKGAKEAIDDLSKNFGKDNPWRRHL